MKWHHENCWAEQSFRYVSDRSLFDPAGCSWCHLQELSLHQTANQRQECVWMSVNHFAKMGYNLSPLITASMGRVTHCWPSPLNMLTVCHQLTHLSIAMQSVNGGKEFKFITAEMRRVAKYHRGAGLVTKTKSIPLPRLYSGTMVVQQAELSHDKLHRARMGGTSILGGA